MPPKGHTAVTIPINLYARIDEEVKKSKGRYPSISAFVQRAIETHFEEAERERELDQMIRAALGPHKINPEVFARVIKKINDSQDMVQKGWIEELKNSSTKSSK